MWTLARSGRALALGVRPLALGVVAFVMAFMVLLPQLALANNPPGFGGSSSIEPVLRPALLAFEGVEDDVWNQPIAEIRFRGNRRVESDAMLLELDSNVGELVTPDKLARDLKALWALGYFEDVYVEGELAAAGAVLTYVVKERPTIRKLIVEGNSKVKLDDINEILNLEGNSVLELGAVKANVEMIKALYTQNGFFLAEIDYAVRPVEGQPGKVDVVFVVNEAEEVIVRSITFVGNTALTDDDLRKVMITRIGGYLTIVSKKSGGVFNREAFVADYANLRAYYADVGYFDADFEDVEMALSPDRRFVHLTLAVDEGPQYRIGAITGREQTRAGEDPLFPPAILAESIDPLLRTGDVASAGSLQLIQQDIERRYKDKGYAYVNVLPNYQQDREKLLLYVDYQIDKGPLVYIERVNIFGNDRTADKVIRREIVLTEGDLYSESAKEATQLRVLRLGYFEDVQLSTSRGTADDRIVVNVEVVEKLTGTFQIGAGFSTIENFVLQAQIQYDNFLGRGTTVTLVAQLSSLRRLFNFSYSTRYFLDSNWWFIINVFNTSNVYPTFTRGSTGFAVSWGYPIPKVRGLTAFIGYNLEYVQVGFGAVGAVGGIFAPGATTALPEQSLINNLFANGLTSAVTARLVYDTRDNVLFPTSGMFHQLKGEFASKYFGSDNEYNRYTFDARFYVPVIKTERSFRAWVVFRSNFQIGYIQSPTDGGVPVFERYFPGGIYGHGSLRGYRLRSLGPRILVQSSPNPSAALFPFEVGGNLLAALNLELEFMVVPPANIKAVVFADIGNAFNTEAQYCQEPNPEQLPKADPCTSFALQSLRYSMGFGFRWQSPIGPLRFEWGFPLDRLGGTSLLAPEDPVVFEFNVGTGF
ncbi:outer membrane protein assembly factor BamA [Enhygromyxa salina]|uniref:outer membrane protein assembly factor BamA n=1 Tax=Enhygromyxa salina TaxID=215803 RepID=UPI00196A1761|nr:outer membrane protein assembly factor BamA [Enhygromyxa salina]